MEAVRFLTTFFADYISSAPHSVTYLQNHIISLTILVILLDLCLLTLVYFPLKMVKIFFTYFGCILVEKSSNTSIHKVRSIFIQIVSLLERLVEILIIFTSGSPLILLNMSNSLPLYVTILVLSAYWIFFVPHLFRLRKVEEEQEDELEYSKNKKQRISSSTNSASFGRLGEEFDEDENAIHQSSHPVVTTPDGIELQEISLKTPTSPQGEHHMNEKYRTIDNHPSSSIVVPGHDEIEDEDDDIENVFDELVFRTMSEDSDTNSEVQANRMKRKQSASAAAVIAEIRAPGRKRIVQPEHRYISLKQRVTIFFKEESYRNIVKYPQRVWRGVKKRYILFIISIILIIGLSIAANLSSRDTCVAYFPHTVTTSFTRRFFGTESPETCVNRVCYAYLTLSNDLSRNMIVNYQAHVDVGSFESSHIQLISISDIDSPKSIFNGTRVDSFCYKLEPIYDEPRYQCLAKLENLKPNSSYQVQDIVIEVKPAENDTPMRLISPIKLKFRTTSDDENFTTRFISGGDMSITSESALALIEEGLKMEPHFALVGGDIAYANGNSFCYHRWDLFCHTWQHKFVTPQGYHVPILTAIGNHEAAGFKRPLEHDGLYLYLFPHDLATADISTDLKELRKKRVPYHFHKLGANSYMIILDSWVHQSPASQKEWLRNVLEENKNRKYRMVSYHASLYPSKPHEIPDIVLDMKMEWEPLFDRYQLNVAFEHHYHLYKVSFPIRNQEPISCNITRIGHTWHMKPFKDSPSIDGTIYLGDGAWGVPTSSRIKSYDPNFIQQVLSQQNMFSTVVSGNGMHIQGMGYDREKKAVGLLHDIRL